MLRKTTAPRRVYYAAGTGDVPGTFHRWCGGSADDREVALTYSGQFFDICRSHDLAALVECTRPRTPGVSMHGIRVFCRPHIWQNRAGIFFHLGQVLTGARMCVSILRFRADVALVSGLTHYFALAPLSLLGVRVVPVLHNTLWPAGHPPRGRVRRVLQALNGWFWRRCAAATVAISEECTRQVAQLARRPRGPLLVARPQYYREAFESCPPPPPWRQRPFVVLYVGRIERSKGALDLVDIAEHVETLLPGAVRWEVCGDGSAMPQLRARLERSPVGDRFAVHGVLVRHEMIRTYGRAHVVIVPTRSEFAEGFNKVVAEAVIAGRPIITSRIVPAAEVAPRAVLEVQADDVRAYAEAVAQLVGDEAVYAAAAGATREGREQFFDRARGWQAGIEQALGLSPHKGGVSRISVALKRRSIDSH